MKVTRKVFIMNYSYIENMDIIHTLDDKSVDQVPSMPLTTISTTSISSGMRKTYSPSGV